MRGLRLLRTCEVLLVGVAIYGAHGLRASEAASESFAALLDASSSWPLRHFVTPAFAARAVREPSASTVSEALTPKRLNGGFDLGIALRASHQLKVHSYDDDPNFLTEAIIDDVGLKSRGDVGTRSNGDGSVVKPRATRPKHFQVFKRRGEAGGEERGAIFWNDEITDDSHHTATSLHGTDGSVQMCSPQELAPALPLVLMKVKDLYESDGKRVRVEVPVEWASKFRRLWAIPQQPSVIYARTNSENFVDMSLARLDTSTNSEDERILFMLRRMRGAAHVLNAIDMRPRSDKTYVLMEPIRSDHSLEVHNADAGVSSYQSNRFPKPAIIPVPTSLVFVVDLLYAADELARRGVVHAYLDEKSVFFLRGRLMTCGLSFACTTDPGEKFTCGPYGDLPETSFGSALRTAPEMVDGWPTGVSNTLWAVGMMFGTLCLGDTPTFEVVFKECGGEAAANKLDTTASGRARIREIIRQKFSVEDHSKFPALDYDIQQLLAGMLDPDPTQRWSVQGSLTYALAIADARGIRISPPRTPTSMPTS